MSYDVFVIASARDPDAAAALRQAMEIAGVDARRVQDAVFGFDEPASRDPGVWMADAELACPYCTLVPSLRAAFLAAAEILSEEAQIVIAAGIDADETAAFVLASPEAVGRLNLAPRARLAARSLSGLETALRHAEITASDIEVTRNGARPMVLLDDLLDELDRRPARWGAVTSGELALLVERL